MGTHPLTPEEMSYLLNMVTVGTRRTFDDDAGSLWLDLLSDYTYDQCHEAFKHYLTEGNDEYLTPALIISYIKEQRLKRWEQGADATQPPNGLTGPQYLEWLHKHKERVMAPPPAPRPAHLRQIENPTEPQKRQIEG